MWVGHRGTLQLIASCLLGYSGQKYVEILVDGVEGLKETKEHGNMAEEGLGIHLDGLFSGFGKN